MSKVLGYWKCRGDIQSIRYMLEYKRVDYVDKLYEKGEDYHCDVPHWDSQQCNTCEPECEFHFEEIKLPYYIDDGLMIIGRKYIINHIALKHDLLGSDDAENYAIKTAEAEAGWMRESWDRLVHTDAEGFEEEKATYEEELKEVMERVSNMMGEIWVSGITLSFADFLLYEEIDVNQAMFPECIDKYENLKEFKTRFENLAWVRPYMQSDRFLKHNLNDPDATWDGLDATWDGPNA